MAFNADELRAAKEAAVRAAFEAQLQAEMESFSPREALVQQVNTAEQSLNDTKAAAFAKIAEKEAEFAAAQSALASFEASQAPVEEAAQA